MKPELQCEEALNEFKKRRSKLQASRNESDPNEEKFTPDPDDVIVVTQPKSGTTWILHICHQLRMGGIDPDFDDQLDVITWIERSLWLGQNMNAPQVARPRVFKSHLPYNKVPQGGRMIFCTRDVKDILYSRWKFVLPMLGLEKKISLRTWVELHLQEGTVTSWLSDLKIWWQHQHEPNILFLFFDDLKQNHTNAVWNIGRFIGIPYDETLVDRVVQTTTHSFMSQHHTKFDNHKISAYYAEILELGNEQELIGLVRKDGGRSGDGTNFIPVDLQQRIDELWNDIITHDLDFKSLQDMQAARQPLLQHS